MAVGSGGNGPVAASSNNSGGGGHRGGGGKGGSRYVPPHLRSGKGGGGFEDNGEDQGTGGYDQDRGGERGEKINQHMQCVYAGVFFFQNLLISIRI